MTMSKYRQNIVKISSLYRQYIVNISSKYRQLTIIWHAIVKISSLYRQLTIILAQMTIESANDDSKLFPVATRPSRRQATTTMTVTPQRPTRQGRRRWWGGGCGYGSTPYVSKKEKEYHTLREEKLGILYVIAVI